LRGRILSGELQPGNKLPGHAELAAQFGVAVLTLRQVLGTLEDEGLVSREVGRGTFVRSPSLSAVLIVDDSTPVRSLVRALIEQAGYRALEAGGPQEALDQLRDDPDIRLLLTDVRMPRASDGLRLIRQVRLRWPQLPIAVITGYPEDLAGLHGTPDYPVLILSKPAPRQQLEEALRLALPARRPVEPGQMAMLTVGTTPAAAELRACLRRLGHELEEVPSSDLIGPELRRRAFSHVFLPARGPAPSAALARQLMEEHPETLVVLVAAGSEDAALPPGGISIVLSAPFEPHGVREALRLRRSG
jgi:CheY-like chemotaxis protein